MDFEREDDLMLEEAENTEEQTVEETVEGEVSAAEQETEPEAKTYTDEELNQRVDELLRPKIERAKVKAEKEARQQYEDYIALAEVVNAGIGTSDVKQAIASLTEFYEGKGIKIPARSKESYNEHDLNILAEHEAKQIIEAGYEDVVDETNRLAAKGVEHMSAKEKLIFSKLVEYNKAEKSRQDLLSIGAKSEIIDSVEFRQFAKQFNSNAPAKDVYDLYQKTMQTEKPAPEKIGSLKNGSTQSEKEYYTPEEVDKLTDKELSDPKIFERVRKSMLKWK